MRTLILIKRIFRGIWLPNPLFQKFLSIDPFSLLVLGNGIPREDHVVVPIMRHNSATIYSRPDLVSISLAQRRLHQLPMDLHYIYGLDLPSTQSGANKSVSLFLQL